MTEISGIIPQETTQNVEAQDKIRTPSEIIGDLLKFHEAVEKGEKSRGFLVSEQLKGAKEMLANGDEEKAFLLMNTAFQTENGLINRKTAELSSSVADNTAKMFSVGFSKLEESAARIDAASRRMGNR